MISATTDPGKRWVSRRRALAKRRRRPGRAHGVDLDRLAAAQPVDSFVFVDGGDPPLADLTEKERKRFKAAKNDLEAQNRILAELLPELVRRGQEEIAAGKRRCPTCGSLPGRAAWRDDRGRVAYYCLDCDATGHDGLVRWPGLPVDAAPDPDYHDRGPVYEPAPGLAGGVGKLAE